MTRLKASKNSTSSAKPRFVSMEQPKLKLNQQQDVPAEDKQLPKEIGGRKTGLEPTRYGDWEYKGRCIDF